MNICVHEILILESISIFQNTLYTLTIISIQSFDYLLVSNPTIDTIVDPWFKEELYFIALRHSDPCNAEKYKEPLLQKMSESAEALISITNNIILPLSRDLRHPLGSALLNQFLSEFASLLIETYYGLYHAFLKVRMRTNGIAQVS